MTTNFKKKIVFVCSFFIILFFTQSTWKSVPEILIFQKGNADIYFGQFFQPQKSLKINFINKTSENGKILLKRDNKKVKPIAERDSFQFFKIAAGDLLCKEDACKTLEKDGYLVKKLGYDGWWSTQIANIHSYDAPIDRTFSLYSSNKTDLLFVKPDFQKVKFYNLKQGNNRFTLNDFGNYQAWRLIYASLFACIITTLLFSLYQYRQKITAQFCSVSFYSAGLAVVLIIEYIAVFPGIFSTDTVVNHLSADIFSIWYSPIFMAFNRLIYSLYPNFIQLPEILIFYISSVYLACHLKNVRYGKIIILFLLLSQIILPIFFVSIFVQQRIFLSAIIIYAAIIFSCCNLLDKEKIGPIAYGFLIFATLLRPEYGFVFIVFLIYDVWQRRTAFLSLKPTIFTLSSAVFFYFFVNYPLLWIQGVDRDDIMPSYKLVSLLDIVKPYVDCNNTNNELSQAIQKSGGLKEYCSQTAEKFYWAQPHRNIDSVKQINQILKHELLTHVTYDPIPEIKRIFSNTAEMSTQNYWQIYNRYLNQDAEIHDFHIKTAERFGLIKFFSWQIKIHTSVTVIFKWLSNYLNVLISLFFITVLGPIISRCRLTIILNSIFIFMTVGIGFAAPVAQWSYLAFIPIWSVLIIPIDAILYASNEKFRIKQKQS